ncbi:MAG: ribonuclease HI family protein, partial [Planctomycetes bacterium]|nr:ribonuclease HI family protein [Planctomycetota bacterium]
MKNFVIHTDGGARGNPGPAAIGAVIEDEDGKVVKEISEYIGETTNNEAEYRAAITALKKLKALVGKAEVKKSSLQVMADSELLVKQMNGQYKVESENTQKFFLELWNLKVDFGKVEFHHIPREQNKQADRLVNEALDAKGQ